MNKISILRSVDKYIGNLIISFLSIFKTKTHKNLINKKPKNVLIIRLWTLGESLLTLPMIKRLKENGHNISVLVTKRSKGVFENVDFVDEIIDFENFWEVLKKFKKYDVVIDTEPYLNISAILGWFLGRNVIGFKGLFRDKLYDFKIEYNDKIHAVYNFCNMLRPFGIDYKPERLVPLKYTEKDKKNVDKLLKKHNLNDKKIIGIHCGTAETAPWRSWKKEKFAKLIEKLVEDGFYVVLTGSKGDCEANEKVLNLVDNKFKDKVFNFAGKTNLREFACLLTKFEVFVSNDTGPMHLSAAMGTKTVGLFGPNLPERFAPFGEGNIAIYKAGSLDCSPCINVHKGEFKECKLNGKCMDLIEVEDVYNVVVNMVRK
ncbi:glycosyl transferase family protein [Methanocaldococcus bathoardescens]|uniref:Glycosyl transferase family protein n=1 Tax=Methanocaldococcus bathoardescens TaxID=1301915 RepID=A0A076L9B3_9EURY|nr:glycosyltransferase family 9 protein [Methanocaldococcus bathoardescens]AIJ04915.1 glycosyl transferase family protein [Methanocaldococcus bathoardescens]